METPIIAPELEAPRAQAAPPRSTQLSLVQTAEPQVEYAIDELDFIQPRGVTDEDKVEDFAEAYAAGKQVPPPTVWMVDGRPVIVDGNHRARGRQKAGFDSIECRIAGRGTRKDAVEEALRSNHTNGLHRTRKMKREYVRLALLEFSDRSDRALAELCGVTDKLVSAVASELRIIRSSRVGADGKTRRLPAKTTQPTTRLSGAPPEPAYNHEERKEPHPAGDDEHLLQGEELAVSSALRSIQIACIQLLEAGPKYAPRRSELLEAEDRLHKEVALLQMPIGSKHCLVLDTLHDLIRHPDSHQMKSRFFQEVRESRSRRA